MRKYDNFSSALKTLSLSSEQDLENELCKAE